MNGPDTAPETPARTHRREPIERRTHSKVRRESVAAGGERGIRITRDQAARRIAALERLGKDTRKPGKRRGCAGTVGLYAEKIHAYFLDLAVKYQGQVFPAYEAIAAAVGCTVRTAVRSVAQLEALGWLKHDRRYEETGRAGVRGPQVQQTSNFYHLLLPNVATQLLERWRRKKAPTQDEAAEAEQAAKKAFREACEDLAAAERREAQRRAQEAESPVIALAAERARRELAAKEAALARHQRDVPEG